MNIKSLLLGSAAAMVAVSGAQAADAIVVEPEPVEYVRVCDAYGSGFFFIPGTETCIRFSGFVRSSYEKEYLDRSVALDALTGTDGTAAPVATGDLDFTFWGQRARLNIDVRSETDWGTLRAQYRLEGGDSNEDADIDMDRALISLAGFRAGFSDNYWSTNHGYAGVNLTGIAGVNGGRYEDDGFYGFNDATLFDYTWAADGFSVTVGVEDPRINFANNGIAGIGNTIEAFGGDTTTAFANFYAGFNWNIDAFTLAFTAVHDSQAIDYADTFASGTNQHGVWAFKVSANLDLSEFIPGGILYGSYMWDDDGATNYVHANGALADPESIYTIAFQADLTDELEFVAQYSYAEGSDAISTITSGAIANEDDAWLGTVGLNWFPAAAPGFSIRGSYRYGEANRVALSDGAGGFTVHDEEVSGWFVGVRRDF